MDLLYFIILVSSLIFVHELGHFMFAKLFGVKVMTFSLGFGPKVIRLRGRETEYCLGILPFGGYVKMLEASKSDIVLPEDRHRTFESLSVLKRVTIVLAGPVMNLVFPVLLYFAVFVSEGPLLAPTVGVVLPGHPAHGKLLPGDRVMAINGHEIGTFDELQRLVAKSPGELLRMRVFRDNRQVDVEIVAEETTSLLGSAAHGDVVQATPLDIEERIGSIGIMSSAPASVVGIADPDSPAYRAGLRTFDVVVQVAGRPIRRFMDLDAEFSSTQGETVPVTYLRPVPVEDALGSLAEMAVYEAGVVALTPDPSGLDLTGRTGIESADLYVAYVREGSSLYKADLRPGDKLLRLDDEEIPAWSTFLERVKKASDRPHRIEFLAARDGRRHSGTFEVGRVEYTDENGQSIVVYMLGRSVIDHWAPVAIEDPVSHPTPVRYALTKAIEETVRVTRFTSVLFVRLLQGRISLESLSGPITIYRVAGEEGRKGPGYFVWVMALISINLGILNLLPIPVLDGGHLAFLVLETAMRRPVPLRLREFAHLLGMGILIALMVLVFKNDFDKQGDVIWGQLRELVR
ncbi:MAG: RIP metalloprotease RseP [Polyangiaceae bacterium]|nr:RIP metalloprotease RseP [Polyangiaceae bacterium]